METPAEIVASLGYKLLSSEPLTGGVSATTLKLTVQSKGGIDEQWVLREATYGLNDIEPGMHSQILELLAKHGLQVPKPVAADEAYLITTYVEGSTEPPRNLDKTLQLLARALNDIHSISISKSLCPWIPELAHKVMDMRMSSRPHDERLSESLLREVAEEFSYINGSCEKQLCHGDYWPGNILWRNDKIAAIIDWEDCCLGNPLYDLANARLEILWKWGQRAMEQFSELYSGLRPFESKDLRFWDLLAALRPAGKLHTWCLPPKQESQMVQLHKWFVQQALSM